METAILSVGPATPLLDVHRLFMEEEISGAPVVDDDGTLLGVITATDLLRAVEEEHDSARVAPNYFRDLLSYSSPDWSSAPEDFQDRLRQLRAEDFMTTQVVTVAPETPVTLVARSMRENRIHRVFVSRDAQLIGLISAFDLLRLIEDHTEALRSARAARAARNPSPDKIAAVEEHDQTVLFLRLWYEKIIRLTTGS
jgi:CBS domain-containing protein